MVSLKCILNVYASCHINFEKPMLKYKLVFIQSTVCVKLILLFGTCYYNLNGIKLREILGCHKIFIGQGQVKAYQIP